MFSKIKQVFVDYLAWLIVAGVGILCAVFIICGTPSENGSITLDGNNAQIEEYTEKFIENANDTLYRIMNEDAPTDESTIKEFEDAEGLGAATSNLLYKNVLDGNATATFAGNIYVAPGAHNTDAYQSNRNLLLSEDATVNSLPGLEILADKVRCSHGSASAPVNEEQLFYLLSRGISREAAISLLSHGFIKDAIEKYEQS